MRRYLSPEPLLQEPKWVSEEVKDGFSTPTYSYAANNPLRYLDPNGADAVDSRSQRQAEYWQKNPLPGPDRMLTNCVYETVPANECPSGFATNLSCVSSLFLWVNLGSAEVPVPGTQKRKHYRIGCTQAPSAAKACR